MVLIWNTQIVSFKKNNLIPFSCTISAKLFTLKTKDLKNKELFLIYIKEYLHITTLFILPCFWIFFILYSVSELHPMYSTTFPTIPSNQPTNHPCRFSHPRMFNEYQNENYLHFLSANRNPSLHSTLFYFDIALMVSILHFSCVVYRSCIFQS